MLRTVTGVAFVAAFMIATPGKAECTIKGRPIADPHLFAVHVVNAEAACLIGESDFRDRLLPDSRPDGALGNEFCDLRDHERDIQAIHPKLGYLICSITWLRQDRRSSVTRLRRFSALRITGGTSLILLDQGSRYQHAFTIEKHFDYHKHSVKCQTRHL